MWFWLKFGLLLVDGRKGRAEVKNTVDSGEAVAGFVVRKVSTRMIMNLADANHLLPPKVRHNPSQSSQR